MGLSVVTPPTQEPVDIDALKLHLKIDTNVDEGVIATLGLAAREYLEAATRRTFIYTTLDYTLDAFPCGPIVLPMPPVSSVTSVSYVDTNGDTQVWAAGATGYRTSLPQGPHAEPGQIFPAYGIQYPVTRCQKDAVTVRFVAGYGPSRSSVPAMLIAAHKHLVEHWYVNRGVLDAGINSVTSKIPMGLEAMIGAFKLGWA